MCIGELFPWLMNNWQIPSHKKIESVVKRKLSLIILLWSYVRIFCHM
jgi:hypothetical protein